MPATVLPTCRISPSRDITRARVTLSVAEGSDSYHVDVTSELQSVLDGGASVAGVRFDPITPDTYATGVYDIRLTAAAPSVGAVYDIWLVPNQSAMDIDFGNRNLAPYVKSIVPADPNPTAAATVDFTVTFSEAVTGVDETDFSVTATGISGASVTAVSGSGADYTVTVDTGTGDGTLRLDLQDDDSIARPDRLSTGRHRAPATGTFWPESRIRSTRHCPRSFRSCAPRRIRPAPPRSTSR